MRIAGLGDPGAVIHFELYVIPKSRRAQFRRRARKPLGLARELTVAGGGSGPHLYRVDEQRATGRIRSLVSLVNLQATEDLWIELTFYATRRGRRATMKRIWSNEQLASSLHGLESLNAERPRAWAVANGVRQRF